MAPSLPTIVVDTGFVLSVAAIDGLAPLLGERWAGRTTWPREVHSELLHRQRTPGRGVPAGLAQRALNGAQLWLPAPTDLAANDTERLLVIAGQLGGTDDRQHYGEAAGAVLAERTGGILATEDRAAANLIQINYGVRTTNMTALLEALAADGTWTTLDVTNALKGLQAKSRPNVEGLTAAMVIDGTWRR